MAAPSGGLMPPPPDFGDLSLLPHDSRQDDIIACVVVTWLIGAAFVAARFYTRLAINGSVIGASEWTILAACVRAPFKRHMAKRDADCSPRYRH
jgi:hypothetical protein